MKKSELRKMIKEEIKSVLNEESLANVAKKVADVYNKKYKSGKFPRMVQQLSMANRYTSDSLVTAPMFSNSRLVYPDWNKESKRHPQYSEHWSSKVENGVIKKYKIGQSFRDSSKDLPPVDIEDGIKIGEFIKRIKAIVDELGYSDKIKVVRNNSWVPPIASLLATDKEYFR